MGRARFNRPKDCPYVGKGGLKLAFALEYFNIDISNRIVADLGCHIGGFTDCLLQHGASVVYAVDTGYGILDWKLRNDLRVKVCERTNALYWDTSEKFDMVVCDLGWTRQQLVLPVIAKILSSGGIVLTLVKPQYEAPKEWVKRGILLEEYLPDVLQSVRSACPSSFRILGEARSPVLGSGGNVEYWIFLERLNSSE